MARRNRRPEKPEDFRDRVTEMIKRGMHRAEMVKEFDCGEQWFSGWFIQEFPGLIVSDLRSQLGIIRYSHPNPAKGKKYDKPEQHQMTDEERELAHQRVREAEADYLPRTVVPVRYMTDDELKRM